MDQSHIATRSTSREKRRKKSQSCNRNNKEKSCKLIFIQSCVMKKDKTIQRNLHPNKSNNETLLVLFMVQWRISYYLWTRSSATRRDSKFFPTPTAVVYVPPRTSSRAKLRLRARSGG